jgi:hypothetical protein
MKTSQVDYSPPQSLPMTKTDSWLLFLYDTSTAMMTTISTATSIRKDAPPSTRKVALSHRPSDIDEEGRGNDNGSK